MESLHKSWPHQKTLSHVFGRHAGFLFLAHICHQQGKQEITRIIGIRSNWCIWFSPTSICQFAFPFITEVLTHQKWGADFSRCSRLGTHAAILWDSVPRIKGILKTPTRTFHSSSSPSDTFSITSHLLSWLQLLPPHK